MMLNRAEFYNASVRKLEQLEKEGTIFVIRPDEKLEVSRLENKPYKTAAVYDLAMDLARKIIPDLQNWLKERICDL